MDKDENSLLSENAGRFFLVRHPAFWTAWSDGKGGAIRFYRYCTDRNRTAFFVTLACSVVPSCLLMMPIDLFVAMVLVAIASMVGIAVSTCLIFPIQRKFNLAIYAFLHLTILHFAKLGWLPPSVCIFCMVVVGTLSAVISFSLIENAVVEKFASWIIMKKSLPKTGARQVKEHTRALKILQRCISRNSAYVLCLRSFSTDACVSIGPSIYSYDPYASPIVITNHILRGTIEDKLIESLPRSIPLIGIQNQQGTHTFKYNTNRHSARSKGSRLVMFDNDSWKDVVDTLIRFASFIVVEVESSSIDIEWELNQIAQAQKVDQTLVVDSSAQDDIARILATQGLPMPSHEDSRKSTVLPEFQVVARDYSITNIAEECRKAITNAKSCIKAEDTIELASVFELLPTPNNLRDLFRYLDGLLSREQLSSIEWEWMGGSIAESAEASWNENEWICGRCPATSCFRRYGRCRAFQAILNMQ